MPTITARFYLDGKQIEEETVAVQTDAEALECIKVLKESVSETVSSMTAPVEDWSALRRLGPLKGNRGEP